MFSRRIQLHRIKEKFSDIKRFSLEEYTGYDLPSETIAPVASLELAAAVKVRVWKVLQLKFQDHVAVEMLRQRDWTRNHLDHSVAETIKTGQNGNLTADNNSSGQGWFFENLHDENDEEVFEDIVDGGFMFEEYESIEHDAFDELLWDENLTMEAPICLSSLSGGQIKYPNSSSSVQLQNEHTKRTQNWFPDSVKYSVDSGSSSVCNSPLDELLDVPDQGTHVNADESLLDDFARDEGFQSLDPATDHGLHYDMMMDD